jgi:hypothetical protein
MKPPREPWSLAEIGKPLTLLGGAVVLLVCVAVSAMPPAPPPRPASYTPHSLPPGHHEAGDLGPPDFTRHEFPTLPTPTPEPTATPYRRYTKIDEREISDLKQRIEELEEERGR